MQVLNVHAVGSNLDYSWPGGDLEHYQSWIEYNAAAPDSEHVVRIGFGVRHVYGQDRRRVVVWIDDHPHAQFLGADDFSETGDVLSEIKIPGDTGERICRYREEAVPERYSGLSVVGLPTRVSAKGVHKAWAVLANISEHRAMVALGALRRLERNR